MRSLSLQKQDMNAQLVRASIIVDIQLAEDSIFKQCSRWPKARSMAKDIGELRSKVQDSITSNVARSIIGA